MRASWKLGRLAGIPVHVHWTFFILIGYVVYHDLTAGETALATLEDVGFVLALFACVVLHEMGHALAARHYGVPTSDITLLPIGGVARLQRIPEHPVQELVIAVAGPLVNVVIAGALYLAGVRVPAIVTTSDRIMQGPFLSSLLWVNIVLFLFNLLPAFPMDGGRVLRALLAMRLEYARATQVAATIGQIMALMFAFVGLQGAPWLLLIALFVWIGAESEAAMVQERQALKGVKVREAMLTEFHTLAPETTLGRAAELLLAGSQTDFPVLSAGHPVGVLARADLLSGLARGGASAAVADYQRHTLGTVEANEPLGDAIGRLRDSQEPCLQVVENGQPVGLLTLENVGEYLLVRTALAGSTARVVAPTSA